MPGGVLYADLPALRADVAAAVTTANAAPVVTITSPADADTYTVTEATAGAGATVSFLAGATDDTTASTDVLDVDRRHRHGGGHRPFVRRDAPGRDAHLHRDRHRLGRSGEQ